ncbi:MAG: YdcF family protein [Alkalinema sp. RU_4_3]|nr:YdcF family protein [Alkalinema sp. RU_4_3]
MSWRRYQLRKHLRRGIVVVGVVLTCYIPVRLSIATVQAPEPQAILTLGGATSREAFTAEFAQTHGDLKIWISSGLSQSDANKLFNDAGVDFNRVRQDREATDTVTNFTTIVDQLQQQRVNHVYLITSDFHMARASAIATLVLGSRGIRFTPVSVPSQEREESPLRIVRDIGRSLLWIFTGRTGSGFRSEQATYRINNKIFGSNEHRKP